MILFLLLYIYDYKINSTVKLHSLKSNWDDN